MEPEQASGWEVSAPAASVLAALGPAASVPERHRMPLCKRGVGREREREGSAASLREIQEAGGRRCCCSDDAPDVANCHSYWHVTGSEAENDVGPTPPVGSHVNWT